MIGLVSGSLSCTSSPKDGTPGCTAEACAFRDSHDVFAETGAEVIGVSSDSVDSHVEFAGRHELPFTLLSDQGGQVRKLYGVPSVLGLLPGRVTYVIDRQGTVRHTFNSMTKIGRHIDQALDMVKRLTADRTARLVSTGGFSASALKRLPLGQRMSMLPVTGRPEESACSQALTAAIGTAFVVAGLAVPAAAGARDGGIGFWWRDSRKAEAPARRDVPGDESQRPGRLQGV